MLEQVVRLVSKGYYFYAMALGSEDDMPAFEREMKNWVGEVKRKTAMTHPLEDLQYISFDRFCLLMATSGLQDMLAHNRLRIEDIRQKPLPCLGYNIKCKKLEDGYFVSIEGPSGKPLDLLRG